LNDTTQLKRKKGKGKRENFPARSLNRNRIRLQKPRSWPRQAPKIENETELSIRRLPAFWRIDLRQSAESADAPPRNRLTRGIKKAKLTEGAL
jgi:hypothetical protein